MAGIFDMDPVEGHNFDDIDDDAIEVDQVSCDAVCCNLLRNHDLGHVVPEGIF